MGPRPKEVPAAQVSLVGFGTDDLWRRRRASDLFQTRSNRARCFAWQRYTISRIAVVAFRPEVCIAAGVDQLYGHVHFVPRSADSALHDAINPEFERDIPDLPMHPPVLHGRSPRDNPQSR